MGAGAKAGAGSRIIAGGDETVGEKAAAAVAAASSSDSGRVTKDQRKELEGLVATAKGKSQEAKAGKNANAIAAARSALVSFLQEPRFSGEVLKLLQDHGMDDLIDQAIDTASDEVQAQALRSARGLDTGDAGEDIKVGKDKEGNITVDRPMTDAELKKGAKAGDSKAIDQLLDIVKGGGERGVWAKNQLLDLVVK